jgi:hypothetical protein
LVGACDEVVVLVEAEDVDELLSEVTPSVTWKWA